MGIADKASNAAEDFGGKAKEAAGNLTGNDELAGEGKADQISSAIKDGVEKAKDALGDLKDKLTGN
ncbi:CsbD family protein [Antrihabitans cavernicola]|uniref:CsbD family protein n=1 Tax=Antrihabitans cavernicola TaxID=2495913 RepID=A0A5A7SIL3_9NOCA|nr:CsbD family protein [Spelaeibacter cavernicola]KAA0024567.1 CsbD family protein [Spelaeibacter cavernicola]